MIEADGICLLFKTPWRVVAHLCDYPFILSTPKQNKEDTYLKIETSFVGMESARSYASSWKTSRRFMITDYRNSDQGEENNLNLKDQKEEDSKKVVTLEDHKNNMAVGKTHHGKIRESENTIDNLRQLTVRYIFELLFAQRRGRLKQWMEEQNCQQNQEISGAQGALTINLNTGNLKQLNMVQESYYEEQEYTSFKTQGVVQTADGRTINFGVNLEMSQSFTEYYREELAMTAVKLCDPIVLNFDTDMTRLSDQTFFFDLDVDGEQDEISTLETGSGFLALDKNGNGRIDDGSELFGATSQDGFADLAKYDEDHNGWIDENDAVFDKLKIWCKDENGKDVLYKLKDKGVGAICLQNVSTQFGIKDNPNNLKGQISRTGVFLYENGNVGTIQHVDLAKYERNA